MRFIFVLIWAFVWAYICGAAMEKKRRESSAWYVLGFLFGGLAYIVTLFIKPREPEYDEIEIQRMVAADKVRALKSDISTGRVWVCPQCNKMNDRCRTDFADIQNKKECGGNRQWQNHYLRNWAANTKGKGII